MEPSQQGSLPRPGDVVAGRFHIERTLGVGGMGGVFAAQDLQRGSRVALKVMLPHLMQSAEFAGRFVREAKAASSLVSPHVAQVYEIGQGPDGAPFMVMELLEGKDLDQTLRARGPLPIPEVAYYVIQACHAIAEAHVRGIVHRDLKPSNLFLATSPGARPMVKVLDFGISKSSKLDTGNGPGDALTATDTTLGSPHYMSPEQLRSAKRVDQRTDIWALGIILHKLLTGSLAFESESVGAHLAMIISDPPTPLRVRRPDAPVELEAVILRCLQKDLSVRFQNVGQLALALAPFATTSARPTVESIVATVGRDAYLPLPPLGSSGPVSAPGPHLDAPTVIDPRALPVVASADVGTAPGWSPAQSAQKSRRNVWVAVVSTALVAGVGVTVALIALGPSRAPASSDGVDKATVASAAPPASAVVAAPAKSAAASAAPVAEAKITLALEPKDAEVELDGVVVRDNPLHLPPGDKIHKLVVRAAGYTPEARELSVKGDQTVSVALRKASGAAPAGRKTKVQLETNL